jgi:hypothetical protein
VGRRIKEDLDIKTRCELCTIGIGTSTFTATDKTHEHLYKTPHTLVLKRRLRMTWEGLGFDKKAGESVTLCGDCMRRVLKHLDK